MTKRHHQQTPLFIGDLDDVQSSYLRIPRRVSLFCAVTLKIRHELNKVIGIDTTHLGIQIRHHVRQDHVVRWLLERQLHDLSYFLVEFDVDAIRWHDNLFVAVGRCVLHA